MTYLLVQVLNALSYSVLLLLAGLGLVLVLNLMNFVNLAHGSFFLLGAYVTTLWLNSALPWWLALPAAVAAASLAGALLDRFPFARFYNRDHLMQVLLTYGLLVIFADLMRWVFGAETLSPQLPAILRGGVWLGQVPFPIYRLFLIGAGVLLALALWLLLERSNWGATLRACVADRGIAETLGINTRPVFTAGMVLAAALAGLAGALGAGILSAHPGQDEEMLLQALLVVVIGGLGSLRGTVASALLVGFVATFASVWFSSFSGAITLAAMLALLVLRPDGLTRVQARVV